MPVITREPLLSLIAGYTPKKTASKSRYLGLITRRAKEKKLFSQSNGS